MGEEGTLWTERVCWCPAMGLIDDMIRDDDGEGDVM